MCPPALLMIASAGISAMGAIQAGNAQAAAAKNQANQYEAQARLQKRQAEIELITGGYTARRKQEELDRLQGTQRNRIAGSGVTIEGSPTDLMLDTQREGMLDIAAIEFGQDLKADNLYYGAEVSKMNAKGSRAAASMARTSSIIGAVSPFISMGTKLGGSFG